MKLKKFSLISRDSDSSNWGIKKTKMFIQQVEKLMEGDT